MYLFKDKLVLLETYAEIVIHDILFGRLILVLKRYEKMTRFSYEIENSFSQGFFLKEQQKIHESVPI